VTERRAAQRRELYAQHPEFGSPETPADQLPEEVRVTLMQEMSRVRDEAKGDDNRAVVQALRTIVERAAG